MKKRIQKRVQSVKKDVLWELCEQVKDYETKNNLLRKDSEECHRLMRELTKQHKELSDVNDNLTADLKAARQQVSETWCILVSAKILIEAAAKRNGQ